jgi:hypothetical protein
MRESTASVTSGLETDVSPGIHTIVKEAAGTPRGLASTKYLAVCRDAGSGRAS